MPLFGSFWRVAASVLEYFLTRFGGEMFQVGVEVILTAVSLLADSGVRGFITLRERLACGGTRQAGLHACYHARARRRGETQLAMAPSDPPREKVQSYRWVCVLVWLAILAPYVAAGLSLVRPHRSSLPCFSALIIILGKERRVD